MVSLRKVLVVGATGATGKHVVQMLLDRGDTTVVALVRSKGKMMNMLNLDDGNNDEKNKNKNKNKKIDNLILEEAAIAELGNDKLQDLTKGCQAVVSCLGHNLTFRGAYREGYFLRDAIKGLGAAINSNDDDDEDNKGEKGGGCRFIVMGSDGIAHPDGVTDSKRSYMERFVLFLLRNLLPPHADNEMTAAYLYQQQEQKHQKQQEPSSPPSSPPSSFDWCYVRPGDLIDDKKEKEDDGDDSSDKKEKVVVNVNDNEEGYEVFDRTSGPLFSGDNFTTRYDVAAFMTKLATMDQKIWKEQYNHKMPVIYHKNKKNND